MRTCSESCQSINQSVSQSVSECLYEKVQCFMVCNAEAELQTAEVYDAAMMETSRAFPATRQHWLITKTTSSDTAAYTHSRRTSFTLLHTMSQ